MKSFRPITYVTFGESPNGIFKSQVVDVVHLYRSNTERRVKLVSFISLRGFFKSRRTIKNWDTKAIVLPMVPRLENWALNAFLLSFVVALFNRSGTLIGRGVFATNLLLRVKKSNHSVVYDGRGAIWAEAKEYNVYKNVLSNTSIFKLEQIAVKEADRRIAVSNKLVAYWKKNFNYTEYDHTIIPCSYKISTADSQANLRTNLGWNTNDIVFIYAGSLEGWQGMGILGEVLKGLLSFNTKFKLLLLASENETSASLMKQFPKQVKCKWLIPEAVSSYLRIGDYGLLLRPDSITNEVASPVKFAEYLGAGLKVLISPNIGDFSKYTSDHNVGMVIQDFKDIDLTQIGSNLEKERILSIANAEFGKEKENIIGKYLSIIGGV